MSHKGSEDDDLVWQIGDDTQGRSRPVAEQHVRGRSRLNANIVLIGIGLAVLALAAFWAYRWSAAQSAQATLREHITAEDQAARARDAEALLARADGADPTLTAWLQALAGSGLAAPTPDLGLAPLATAPELSFIALGDLSQVQVIRSYSDAEGAVYRYGFDQFYARRADGWQRVAPAAGYWGTVETFWGSRIAIAYTEPDRDLVVDDVGPHIERILVRLCSTEPCVAAAFPIRISLDATYSPEYVVEGGWRDGRFLSPRIAGMPADGPTRERYRRHLAGWAYLQAASGMYLDASGTPDTARLTLVGVCLGALPGERDLQACLNAGIR